MGPAMETLGYLDCPGCGRARPLAFQGGSRQALSFHCRDCLPRYLVLGHHLPGLPSDLSYVRMHGKRLVAQAFDRLRAEIAIKQAASDKAGELLREHLTEDQSSDLSTRGFFDVASRY